MPQNHAGPICASLGHFIATVTVVWCPHHQGYEVYTRVGDDTDDTSWRYSSKSFGPFDGTPDVLADAQAELARAMRADRAAWAAAHEAQG